MCEISGTNYIVSRRMLDHRRMVNLPDYVIQAGGKKFSLPSCSTRPDYPDGGRRDSKPRYWPKNFIFLVRPFSSGVSGFCFFACPGSKRMLRVLGASRAFNSEKSMLLSRLPSIRRHPMPCPNSSGGDALEHTQYGQGFGRQQSNGMPDMATAQSQATSCRDIQTQSRQAVCRETSRYRWAISQSARQSTGLVCRRKESDPSSRPNATFITFTPRPSGASDTRLYTARNDNFIRCLEHARWKGHRRLHAQTPASRIYPVLTTRKCQNPAGFGFASYPPERSRAGRRQLWCSQAPTGHKLAQASSSVPLALYSNIQFMAEYGGTLVPGNY